MKHCFKMVFFGAICVLFLGGHAYAKTPAGAAVSELTIDEELRVRFFAALARAREPRTGMAEWQRLSALELVEKSSGLNLGVARMMEDASAREPMLLSALRRPNPRGISKHPKAKSLTFDLAGKQVGGELKINDKKVSAEVLKSLPQMKMLSFFVLAATILDECRVEEKEINRAFLDQVVAQPWPDSTGKMLLGYLVLRMQRNGCITRAESEKIIDPLLPAIRVLLTGPEATPGSMAGTLYFLMQAGRMNGVSDELLLRFVRLQSAEGDWADQSQKADASAYAAFGAAVLARMLDERGVKISNNEVTFAYKNPPQVPMIKPKP